MDRQCKVIGDIVSDDGCSWDDTCCVTEEEVRIFQSTPGVQHMDRSNPSGYLVADVTHSEKENLQLQIQNSNGNLEYEKHEHGKAQHSES